MIIEKLSQRIGVKANLQLYCDYQREQETQEFSFKTMDQIILESTDLNEFYNEVVDKLKREMEEFEARGSGWRLIEIKYLELRINKYNPLRGSSYIDLPKMIEVKKAVINVKNLDDNKCFMWVILSALHPADDHVDRISKYKPYENELNFEGIEFPVKMEDRVFKRELGGDDGNIDVIPNNEEKYISFSKEVGAKMVDVKEGKQVKISGIKLRFLDSFRFMASSLDNLVKNVKEFRETSKYFPKDKLNLVTRKGVYPYDYMDSWQKCDETKLPKQKDFYNKMNESDISLEDYKYAKNAWNAFNIKTLGEYSDLYVKTDILILADIIEHFRDVCLKTYNLDPAWYFTAPGLSWDAMLKTTKIELEMLDDYNMVLMLEKGTRGGISQCCNRHGKANNKYMNNYNKNKGSNYLMYLNANNLYGWAMSQYLPYEGFKWGSKDVTKISDDSDKGYIIECDLQYPEYLHNFHSDLPL
ncbi:uncharacterized protein TNCV_3298711 [Trichonephila clavipes]|uniref:DNA-directed DNA polymerase n=1 Tax=Trichonephila clavipes TaxID=2585209 RepID=A0A8X6VTL6_TRICX|nr:uncharacterized protein TNCV_3298711 [Trichonephila clavipes]